MLKMAQVVDLPGKKSPFKWRDWDAIALKDLPEVGWVCKELQIGPGRPGQIQGFGGSGKSWIAMALALSVASGSKFLGKYEVRRGRVAHVSHELGSRALASRYRRLANGMMLEPDEIRGRLQLSVLPQLYLNSGNAEQWYRTELAGVDLCIVDSLRRALPGVDENDSKISNHLDMLSRLSDELRTTFIILHHSGKAALASDKDDSGSKKEERGSGRGSSAIEDASGTIWKIEGGGTGPRQLIMARAHDESENYIAPIWVVLETIARDEPHYFTDGQPAVRILCLADEEVARIERRGKRRGNIEKWKKDCRDVFATVQDAGTIGVRQVMRELGDRKTLREALDDLVEAGVLDESGGPNKARLFTVGAKDLDDFLDPNRPINTENWIPDGD